jgi:hypothetical protein
MELKIFKQNSWIASETFYNHFEGKHPTSKQDYPYVSMTTDIIVSPEICDTNPTIKFRVINQMWEDPTPDEDGDTNPISFGFEFSLEEVIYLNKFLESFIKNNKI